MPQRILSSVFSCIIATAILICMLLMLSHTKVAYANVGELPQKPAMADVVNTTPITSSLNSDSDYLSADYQAVNNDNEPFVADRQNARKAKNWRVVEVSEQQDRNKEYAYRNDDMARFSFFNGC